MARHSMKGCTCESCERQRERRSDPAYRERVCERERERERERRRDPAYRERERERQREQKREKSKSKTAAFVALVNNNPELAALVAAVKR